MQLQKPAPVYVPHRFNNNPVRSCAPQVARPNGA